MDMVGTILSGSPTRASHTYIGQRNMSPDPDPEFPRAAPSPQKTYQQSFAQESTAQDSLIQSRIEACQAEMIRKQREIEELQSQLETKRPAFANETAMRSTAVTKTQVMTASPPKPIEQPNVSSSFQQQHEQVWSEANPTQYREFEAPEMRAGPSRPKVINVDSAPKTSSPKKDSPTTRFEQQSRKVVTRTVPPVALNEEEEPVRTMKNNSPTTKSGKKPWVPKKDSFYIAPLVSDTIG
jgi:hypothetical protein